MNANTIELLSSYIPSITPIDGNTSFESDANIDESVKDDILVYLKNYKNLSFGWEFVNILVANDIPFPAFLQGRNLNILWRAYCFLRGFEDSKIKKAFALTYTSRKTTRDKLNGLLISADICAEGNTGTIDIQTLGQKLGMDPEVISCYELLFFNVIDRKQEHEFISSIVYPQGRHEESLEDYLESVKFSTLMLRSGYNNGVDDVLYCAGISGNPFNLLTAVEGAERLEALFMANGYMLARNGQVNQYKAVGVNHARQIMQATKMGGSDVQDNAIPVMGRDYFEALTGMSNVPLLTDGPPSE